MATATVSVENLRIALKRTIPSASTDDSRPVLRGIHLTIEGQDAIVFAAADGFTLAVQRTPATVEGVDVAILGLDDAKALLKALPKGKASDSVDATIEIVAREINVSVGSLAFTFRPIEGTYPDYVKFFPEGRTDEGTQPGSSVALNGAFLTLIGKASVGSALGIVRIYNEAPGKPIVAHIEDSEHGPCTVVVMPMFVDNVTLDRGHARNAVLDGAS